MSLSSDMWLGYAPGGGRTYLDLGHAGCKVLILGSRAPEAVSLVALSAKEADAKPLILDMTGSLANKLSGYFDTFDYHAFLYDAFKLEAPEPWHSQLVASAYATALDLSSGDEAALNSALQSLASEGNMASPASVYDSLGGVGGFRSSFVDGLKGRIGSLKLLDAVDDELASRLLEGNVIVDFQKAPYPQAAELASCLLIAKLLAIVHSTGGRPVSLFLTEASRIFHWRPRPVHSFRLLTELLAWESVFFSTDQRQATDSQILDGCPVRIYSSDAWHAISKGDSHVLSGTFVVEDERTSLHKVFVPRRVPAKTSAYATVRTQRSASPKLTSAILEAVEAFPLSTRDSITQYLAAEFLQSDIDSELANLQSQGHLVAELKDSGSGPKMFTLTLSEKGRSLSRELNG